MSALVYLPLLVPVLAAAAARPLAARLEPRLATWLLTATTVALAAFSTAALALMAASALARAPVLAALGDYSQPALRRGDPVPALAGMAAALLLTGAAVTVAVVIRARARALAESYRRAASMAQGGRVVVVPGRSIEAYALPGSPGRIVVSGGLLDVLDDRAPPARGRARHHRNTGPPHLAGLGRPGAQAGRRPARPASAPPAGPAGHRRDPHPHRGCLGRRSRPRPARPARVRPGRPLAWSHPLPTREGHGVMSAEPPATSEPVPGDPIGVRYPNTARIWNYQLGGKDNFAVDREASDAANAMVSGLGVPAGADTAVESRHLLQRMVDYMVGQAVRQFLDLRSGLPSMANTHQIAHRAAPEARIVYVDNDPLVSTYAAALMAGPNVVTLRADLRQPEQD